MKWMTRTHMTERIDDPFVGEDMVGYNKFVKVGLELLRH
jgi:hypothetical protein